MRKLRFVDERRGKGTRGGLRVVYYWWPTGGQFWLFTLYGKDEADEIGIRKRLIDYSVDTFRRVNVDVYEGRVLLTGIVPEPDDRVEAVRVAWATDGIVDVVEAGGVEVGHPHIIAG